MTEEASPLSDSGFPGATQLGGAVYKSAVLEAFDPRHLNLILLPTEKCNLRCTYCYERFEVGRMKPEVVAAIKSLITCRAEDLATLDVSWFGGEPLAAREVVFEISRHVWREAERYGVMYSSNITTNGYLLDVATSSELIRLGVRRFQVTLDGYGDDHDRARRTIRGSPTFGRIVRNLLDLRDTELGFQVVLRCHYSPESLRANDEMVSFLNREFAGDSRFLVHFKAIERLGGPNDVRISLFTEAHKSRVRSELVRLLASPRMAYPYPQVGSYVCYAAKPNSLMIRADGSVGKCTVALYEGANAIGRLLPDGTLDLDVRKLRAWANGFRTLNPRALACPYGEMQRAARGVEA